MHGVLAGSDIPCRVGHNPTKSQRLSPLASQTFLNREFPAECDGEITAWNYCYYSKDLVNLQTYTATAIVLRLDTAIQQFTIVNTSVLSVFFRFRNYRAGVYCRREELSPENYIAIQQGDIVGVTFPPTNPLLMIGDTNLDNYVIWRLAGGVDASPNISETDIFTQSRSLHLYADISESCFTA